MPYDFETYLESIRKFDALHENSLDDLSDEMLNNFKEAIEFVDNFCKETGHPHFFKGDWRLQRDFYGFLIGSYLNEIKYRPLIVIAPFDATVFRHASKFYGKHRDRSFERPSPIHYFKLFLQPPRVPAKLRIECDPFKILKYTMTVSDRFFGKFRGYFSNFNENYHRSVNKCWSHSLILIRDFSGRDELDQPLFVEYFLENGHWQQPMETMMSFILSQKYFIVGECPKFEKISNSNYECPATNNLYTDIEVNEEQFLARLAAIERNTQEFDRGYRFMSLPLESINMGFEIAILTNMPKYSEQIEENLMRLIAPHEGIVDVADWDGHQTLTDKQFMRLAKLLGVGNEELLTGFATPFRVKNWKSLSQEVKQKTIKLGKRFWKEPLQQPKLRLIITCGKIAREVAEVTGVKHEIEISSGWGSENLRTYETDDGKTVVNLPDLNRCKLLSRGECIEPLMHIFRDFID